jgi:hypothetical protein
MISELDKLLKYLAARCRERAIHNTTANVRLDSRLASIYPTRFDPIIFCIDIAWRNFRNYSNVHRSGNQG